MLLGEEAENTMNSRCKPHCRLLGNEGESCRLTPYVVSSFNGPWALVRSTGEIGRSARELGQ